MLMSANVRAFTDNNMEHNGIGQAVAVAIPVPVNPGFQFNHPDDKNFWNRINTETHGDPAAQDSKLFSSLKLQIEREFPESDELRKNIKYLRRYFGIAIDHENVGVEAQQVVHLTKCFGSFTRSGDTCILLQQTLNLMSYTLHQDNTRMSPFAGMITQEKAEEYLRPDNVTVESYLIRFSESLANKGGFSLAVKADDRQIRHFNIVGNPSEASQNGRYNARLKLKHRRYDNLNADEEEFTNIVRFMKNRLDDEIEDNIYCSHVCPNLSFNLLFRGYD